MITTHHVYAVDGKPERWIYCVQCSRRHDLDSRVALHYRILCACGRLCDVKIVFDAREAARKMLRDA